MFVWFAVNCSTTASCGVGVISEMLLCYFFSWCIWCLVLDLRELVHFGAFWILGVLMFSGGFGGFWAV